ncbi:MAG: hypothetical protein AAF170_06695 [Bacteroidota bacterium]
MSRLLPLLLIASAWVALPAAAQSSDAMQPFTAHVGDWEGEGWIVAGPGDRQTFTVRETLRPILGGSALLMEGSGHEAAMLRVLTFDADTQTYAVQAFTSAAAPIAADVELVDGQLVWTYTDAQDRQVRWTERFGEDGTWVRTGEVSPDGGARWIPVSEITLQRAGA